MADNLSDSIKQGKKNWENVVSNRLNEADISDLGNSTVPSDVSPNAGGGERTISAKHSHWEKVLSDLVNTPEYKELRKKLDPKDFNDMKYSRAAVVRRFTMYLAEKIAEGQPVDVVNELLDTVKQLEEERNKALKNAHALINKFNQDIRHFKQSRKTVKMDDTEIPKAKSPEEFQVFLINAMKHGEHIIDWFINDITKTPKLLTKRDTPGSGHGGSNVRPVSDQGNVARDINVLFSNIKNTENAENNFTKLLAAIYFFYGEMARLDGSILGLKQKAQRILASRKSKEKRDAAKTQGIPGDVEDFFVFVDDEPREVKLDLGETLVAALRDRGDRNEEADRIEQELRRKFGTPPTDIKPAPGDDSLAPLNESTKPGPGKVLVPQQNVVQEKAREDKVSDRKKGISEGWKKYSEKNKDKKNGEDPEGFSIVMG